MEGYKWLKYSTDVRNVGGFSYSVRPEESANARIIKYGMRSPKVRKARRGRKTLRNPEKRSFSV